jgi:predicted ATPase
LIKRIDLTNWTSLRDVGFALGPVQLLIGPNAAGKSNVIDALRFLRDALAFDIPTACTSGRGGLDAIRSATAAAGPVRITLEYFVPDPSVPQSRSDMRYVLEIGTTSSGTPGAQLEELRIKRRRSERGNKMIFFRSLWGVGTANLDFSLADVRRATGPRADVEELPVRTGDPGVLALKALGFLDLFPRVAALREFVQNWQFLDVDLPAIRAPHRYERALALDPTASNLVNVLRTLWQETPEKFQRITDHVTTLLAHVSSLDTEVQHGLAVILVEEAALGRRFEALSTSDGTLRLLAVVTALETMPQHSLLCIEEPEHGVHPLVFGPLLDVIREYCPPGGTRQVLLTTHSPDMLDAAEPAEVRIVDRDPTGSTDVRELDAAELARWQNDFRLGELWRLRQLGGVPA